MRTLVVSDLHLGARNGEDLLRHDAVRAALLAAAREADRVVILGDGLELRQLAHRDAAAVASPLFSALGEACDDLLVLTGNHDHGLTGAWIEARLEAEAPGFLGLEQRIAPAEAGVLATALAEAAAPAKLELAYPGVWLRDDVYAIHGHYLDLHTTVPAIEALAASAMARWVTRGADGVATPDDYEAALAPLYAWLHQLAQRAEPHTEGTGESISARAWVSLAGEGGAARGRVRRALLGAGFAAAVAGLNRAGLGPLERDLSGAALRRGSLHGMREVLRRVGVDAPHVIFGHTHRSGPWPGDVGAEWRTHAGGRLVNTGSWVHQPHFIGRTRPGESPYWPGTAVWVEEAGPPQLVRLLTGPLPA
jgi:hypothetical protein